MIADTTVTSPAIWITWEDQVRNRSLASELGIPLFEIVEAGSRPMRYLRSVAKTIRLIHRKKPAVVFHQNPSIVLGILVLLLKPLYKYKNVSDNHNAGIFPLEGKSGLLNRIGRTIFNYSDTAILHNEQIRGELASEKQNQVIVLPDPIPKIEPSDQAVQPSTPPAFVFICLWGQDEPYEQVFKAAELLNKHSDVVIKVTGNPPEQIRRTKLPDNIQLTGFVSRESYEEMLSNCTGILALTTRKNSLNCAGYEALAVGKPCILSDSETLQNFFGDAMVYTDNSPENIAEAVMTILKEPEIHAKRVIQSKLQYEKSYRDRLEPLYQLLER